ncbi:hypothetical protein BvRS1_03760 [Burkholderia vietnamiensis]|nr:hypothetical protein BvRS1_03760 [Burkholderia vietnamiensis]
MARGGPLGREALLGGHEIVRVVAGVAECRVVADRFEIVELLKHLRARDGRLGRLGKRQGRSDEQHGSSGGDDERFHEILLYTG